VIRVPAEVRRSFRLAVPVGAAFAHLQDVPRWARLFPHVESVDPLPAREGEVWQWTMEPLGPPGLQVRTVYACRYTFDAATRSVTWTPVDGVGNAAFAGGVTLAEADRQQAEGTLWLEAALEIPAPRFMAGVVRAALAVEFGRMTDRFLENLAKQVRNV